MDSKTLQYTEHFLDCVDFVISGRKGAIFEDKRLINEYDPTYYPMIANHLKNVDPRVRREVILLLTELKERQAADAVYELRNNDNDSVRAACLAYIQGIRTDNSTVPELIDIMKHRNGQEFIVAAIKMRSIARKEDLKDIREIYGQVQGEMQSATREILVAIINRNPELRPKSYLILSLPVFPNKAKFMSFLDKSIVYLDIRYRDNISARTEVSMYTYNNIMAAVKKMQIRLYNEKDNLVYYDKDAKQGYDDLEELIIWAVKDLKSKKVLESGERPASRSCPKCGVKMAFSNDRWICPECGHKI